MQYEVIRLENDIIEIKVFNKKGMYVSFINLGAAIKDLCVPNKDEISESIVMHPLNANRFIKSSSYYGKTIGRVSGRINLGEYELNNKKVKLELNDNDHNCLHGGSNGISEHLWNYEIVEEDEYIKIIFTTVAKDDGFNGETNVKSTYIVYKYKNTIDLVYDTCSNEDTLINLTNHTYFNLSGFGRSNILEHELMINADRYTRLENYLITISVDKVNEVMDFRKFKKIGTHMFDSSLKDHAAYGYDHFFMFEKTDETIPQIIYQEKESGRRLKVYTSYHGVVIYTCNYPRGEEVQINHNIDLHDSICIECQYIPNAINMKEYNTLTVQEKNKNYQNRIRFEFDCL